MFLMCSDGNKMTVEYFSPVFGGEICVTFMCIIPSAKVSKQSDHTGFPPTVQNMLINLIGDSRVYSCHH